MPAGCSLRTLDFQQTFIITAAIKGSVLRAAAGAAGAAGGGLLLLRLPARLEAPPSGARCSGLQPTQRPTWRSQRPSSLTLTLTAGQQLTNGMQHADDEAEAATSRPQSSR